jgi:hypothetical protein
MKMFFVGDDDYFDDSITNAFTQAGCTSYLKLHRGTRPSGQAGALFVPVSDEEIPHLIEIVRKLKAEHPIVSLKAFTFPLEECI